MDLTTAFGVLPAVGGCLAGFALRVWSLAAAAAAGLWGVFILIPQLGTAGLFILPLIFGAAIGATTLAAWLWLRPDTSVWLRMTVAMVAALSGGLGLLYNALGGA